MDSSQKLVITSKKRVIIEILTRCRSSLLFSGMVVGSGETTQVYGNSFYCASSTPTSLCTRGL